MLFILSRVCFLPWDPAVFKGSSCGWRGSPHGVIIAIPPKCSEGALGFEGLDSVELESKEVPRKPGANSPSEASQKG